MPLPACGARADGRAGVRGSHRPQHRRARGGSRTSWTAIRHSSSWKRRRRTSCSTALSRPEIEPCRCRSSPDQRGLQRRQFARGQSSCPAPRFATGGTAATQRWSCARCLRIRERTTSRCEPSSGNRRNSARPRRASHECHVASARGEQRNHRSRAIRSRRPRIHGGSRPRPSWPRRAGARRFGERRPALGVARTLVRSHRGASTASRMGRAGCSDPPVRRRESVPAEVARERLGRRSCRRWSRAGSRKIGVASCTRSFCSGVWTSSA